MTNRFFFVLTFLSSLGCGVIGGVFFAFSTFVMPALARIAPQQGIAAMQSINVAVINPAFMLAFLGTATTSAALALRSLFHWREPSAVYGLAAAVLYLVGTIGVTAFCNIPRNNALAAVAPEGAVSLWQGYVPAWTAWNHVRTASSLAAAALFVLALLRGRP